MDENVITELHNFYMNVKKTKIYEWCSIGNHIDCIEFLKYKENYEYLLNTFGQPQKLENVKNKGKYNHQDTGMPDMGNGDFMLAAGLNFSHDNSMYQDDNVWGINSSFVKSVRDIFKNTCKFVTEEFISIPKMLLIPGHKYNNNIINLNFYRQGIQFDYMVTNIYSKYDCNVILEIGGGLGNMAHFQKKYKKNSKYIILDIPHALLMQYTFLTKLGYNVLLLKEYEIDNINSIIKDVDFDVLLILPHHISKINSDIIDLTVNFDSLVEMNPDTVTYYLTNITRISKLFYTVNKVYGRYNTYETIVNNLVKKKIFSVSDFKEQVYGNDNYHFYIALSKDYWISFYKNNTLYF